jgi:NADH:quinone reductase (non-electrogenic)
MAAMALGALGIEMGTRFIVTKECVAHPDYKKALINLSENDTAVIKRSLGQPDVRSKAMRQINPRTGAG